MAAILRLMTQQVAGSPDWCEEPVQTFLSFTSDLQRMADWLVTTGTRTVVMESTEVYWVAAYEMLELRGLAHRRDGDEDCSGHRDRRA